MKNYKKNLPGYTAREEELVAIRAMLQLPTSGVKALFIEGPPGVGKTYLAECLASGIKAEYIFHQFHSWTDDTDLFIGVNIPAAVAGDVNKIEQFGSLAKAAKNSRKGRVVLCLDELDKAPERVDCLLLDFLQSGRVPLGDGTFEQADLTNLLVFITSNKVRDVHSSLKRRCRRLTMRPLPAPVLDELIQKTTGCSPWLARKIRVVCSELAALDKEISSLQEMTNLVSELSLSQSLQETEISVEGWAVRGSTGMLELKNKKFVELIKEIHELL